MRRRPTALLSALGAAILVLGTVTLAAAPARAAEIGHVGPSYAGTTAPTAEKPQSKLWHNDGFWWAAMFNPTAADWHIYRLDRPTQTWVDTGTLIDERIKVWMDVLWDGSKLYVGSAGTSPTSASASVRVYRFSYDQATKTYSRDAGFPVTPVTGGMEALVLERDTTGTLWLTYTRSSKVYVTHSSGSDGTWVSPYVLPVSGSAVTADDISGVVAFGGKIGVLWGNQNDGTYYFAIHTDGAADTTWTREVAYSRPEGSDDHLNLKVIENDPQGRVFAVVKTSLDADDDPLVVLLVRNQDGTWDTDNVVGRKGEEATRAQIVIDGENGEVYAFTAAPCCSGGTIYLKKASIRALLNGNPFGNGLGQVFMQSSANPRLNNPTSTKQTVNDATDLVVLAGDDSTSRYMHNTIEITPADTTAPDTTITEAPSGTVESPTAGFTFTADEPSTFECSLDAEPFTACTSPVTYSGLASGDHSFAVRATDTAGNVDPEPATASWVVRLPLDTLIDSGPSGTVADTPATFAFSATQEGATFACSLDGAPAQACTSPVTYSGLGQGEHTFTVAATVDGDPEPVTDTTPATRTWSIDLSPTLVITPEADARVASAAPNTNYGSATTLEADNSPVYRSLLRFAVTGVPSGTEVTSATLRLWVTNPTGNGPKVYSTSGTWSEGTVTWAGQPALGPQLADVGSTPQGAWVTYNLTSAVQGNQSVSLTLVADSTDGAAYTSREGAAEHAPQLVVQTRIATTP